MCFFLSMIHPHSPFLFREVNCLVVGFCVLCNQISLVPGQQHRQILISYIYYRFHSVGWIYITV